jgi:ABC-type polysaccharide/polyol phosphate export permease
MALHVNPMAGAIALFRGFVMGQPVDVALCLISGVSAALLLGAGLYVFQRTELYFADLA